MKRVLLGALGLLVAQRIVRMIDERLEVERDIARLRFQAESLRRHTEMMRMPLDKRADEERRWRRRA